MEPRSCVHDHRSFCGENDDDPKVGSASMKGDMVLMDKDYSEHLQKTRSISRRPLNISGLRVDLHSIREARSH